MAIRTDTPDSLMIGIEGNMLAAWHGGEFRIERKRSSTDETGQCRHGTFRMLALPIAS